MTALADALGRFMLSLIFITGGVNKLGDLGATGAYMQSVGLPSILAGPAAAFELLSGLAILLGWQTRIVAVVLAGFCIVTGLMFHHDFADKVQTIMFMKNVAMAGGFLTLFAHGAGSMSIDARKRL